MMNNFNEKSAADLSAEFCLTLNHASEDLFVAQLVASRTFRNLSISFSSALIQTWMMVLLLVMSYRPLSAQTDSLRSPDEDLEQVGNKSISDTSILIQRDPWQPDPKKALWFSLAVPGLGQIYNGSWWKTPIIYGGLGVSIWFIRENNRNYKAFRTAYSESFNPDTENELVKRYPNQESLRRARDLYYKWYQLSIIATAAVYLMNGIEAYVDAHLKNFEISDDLSLRYGLPDDVGPVLLPPLIQHPRTYSVIGVSYRLH